MHEGPESRIITINGDDLLGRKRRPADVLRASPPLPPAWSPFAGGHPDPSEICVEHPMAIVVDHPAPSVLLLIRHPVPAPIVRVGPASDRVRPPIPRPIRRHPDFAPARMPFPTPVRLQRGTELSRDLDPFLRQHRRERAFDNGP